MKRLHKSTRLRYSLRAVLLCTFIAAVALAHLVRQDTERRRLIADIRNVGGSVTFDDSRFAFFRSSRVSEVRIPHSACAHFELLRLKAFSRLSAFTLMNPNCVDQHGQPLAPASLTLPSVVDFDTSGPVTLRTRRVTRSRDMPPTLVTTQSPIDTADEALDQLRQRVLLDH